MCDRNRLCPNLRSSNESIWQFSKPETWVPKRGCLKPAGKRQESATFLQRSDFDVAVQFFVCCSAAFGANDVRTAEKRMLQCSFCSAALRKLQRNFRFRLWHVAGVGFRGVGFRTSWSVSFMRGLGAEKIAIKMEKHCNWRHLKFDLKCKNPNAYDSEVLIALISPAIE